jgi:putative GTP pyrophosphokinase
MKRSDQQRSPLEDAYRRRWPILQKLADELAQLICSYVKDELRIDRISARAKDVDRFLSKASSTNDGTPKYTDPIAQIQDQVGARIVVFYQADVERIETVVRKYFRAIEYKNLVPESESEFGYFGRHLVMVIPGDVIGDDMNKEDVPSFFELQIKTLFQHAWAEANHDLGYKPGGRELTSEQKRLIAFTSAQAWGADHIFQQLFAQLRIG